MKDADERPGQKRGCLLGAVKKAGHAGRTRALERARKFHHGPNHAGCALRSGVHEPPPAVIEQTNAKFIIQDLQATNLQ